jgi:acylphosphatase
MTKKRAHVIYSGTVQGVGFRWTAEHHANSLKLTGWVRNCPDGTVEVVCEGAEEDIRDFLQKVKAEMSHYIRAAKVDWEAPAGDLDRFDIKFFGA